MNKIFSFLIMIALVSCNTETITENGYHYTMHTDAGGANAKVGDYVYFLLDIKDDEGAVLQSYRNGPNMPSLKVTPPNEQVYKTNPLLDLMTKLSEGDSVSLFIPTDSLPNVPPGYQDMAHFEYTVVVTDILDEEANQRKQDELAKEQAEKAAALKEKEADIAAFSASSLQAFKSGKVTDAIELEDGLRYVVHEQGDGPAAKEGNLVSMQYYGMLQEDGSMFDNSYKRGTAFTFTPGRGEVIKGWDKVVPLLKEGSKASIFIPFALGYGAAGNPPNIPASADLMFYVEVEKVFN